MKIRLSTILKILGWLFFVAAGALFLGLLVSRGSKSLRLTCVFVVLYTFIVGIYFTTLSWLIRLLRCTKQGLKTDGRDWYVPDEVEKFRWWWPTKASGYQWVSFVFAVMGVALLMMWYMRFEWLREFAPFAGYAGGIFLLLSLALLHFYRVGREVAELLKGRDRKGLDKPR